MRGKHESQYFILPLESGHSGPDKRKQKQTTGTLNVTLVKGKSRYVMNRREIKCTHFGSNLKPPMQRLILCSCSAETISLLLNPTKS